MKTKTQPASSRSEPVRTPPGPPKGGETTSDQADGATGKTDSNAELHDEHEGATEDEVGDRTGPGAGYDQEPDQERDTGGVA